MVIQKHLSPEEFLADFHRGKLAPDSSSYPLVHHLESGHRMDDLLYSFANNHVHRHGDHFHDEKGPVFLWVVGPVGTTHWMMACSEDCPEHDLIPAILCLKAMHPERIQAEGSRKALQMFHP